MGKNATGEKPKFDLITASKTKKYKIITGVILGLGVLILAISLLMKSLVTQAVVPNSLNIENLSNLQGNHCIISNDQCFTLSTGTTPGRALADPIKFTLLDGADAFLEVRDDTDRNAINTSYYNGLFYLHIRENAPTWVENSSDGTLVRPTGILRITCGSHLLEIHLEYHAI